MTVMGVTRYPQDNVIPHTALYNVIPDSAQRVIRDLVRLGTLSRDWRPRYFKMAVVS